MPVPIAHKDELVRILVSAASDPFSEPKEVFRNLLFSAHLPKHAINKVRGRLSGNPEYDARNLVEAAILWNVNTDDPRFTALGSLLWALLATRPPEEDARALVAILLADSLIIDSAVRAELIARFQVPLAPGATPLVPNYGPDIDWLGPPSDLELQGFFRSDPPWLDVGFLRLAIARSSAVCRLENGSTTGTGFLLGPARVLTNYHVLWPAQADPATDPTQNLLLRFGLFTVAGGDLANGKEFKVKSILGRSPVAELDFALLEVDPAISAEKDISVAPYSVSLPGKGSSLNILHHPSGDAMKLSTSINGITGVYEDRSYLQYTTQAMEGSSGSPCFNDRWSVVALHHAQRARPIGSIREGILIRSIHKRIGTLLPAPTD